MSDLILYINDKAVDIEPGTAIAITKQAGKIGDANAILADGTNEFVIPPTPNNKDILENADVFNADTDVPYTKLSSRLVQEGYETIQNGISVLNNYSGKFNLQVLGGNASFFSLIKDLKLSDLDLSAYDHFWTNQNVFDNRNNLTGLIYALFEQCSTDQETPDKTLSTYGTNLYAVQTKLLLYCYYTKTLLEKVFAAQGYNFVSDITALDIYTKEVIFRGSDWNRGTDSSYLNVKTAGTVDVELLYDGIIGSSIPSPMLELGQITEQNSNYWDETTLNSLLLNGRVSHTGGLFEVYGSVIKLPDATRVTVRFNLVINNPNSGGTMQIFVGVGYTTEDGESFINEPAYDAPPGISNYSFEWTFDVAKIPTQGDYFFAGETGAFFSVYSEQSIGNVNAFINKESTAEFTFEFLSAYDITTTLPYNYIRGISGVSDMTQTDLLKYIGNKFSLLFQTDPVQKKVYGTRFDKVKENIPEGIDFSELLHYPEGSLDKRPSVTYRLANYGQRNYYKWQPDDLTGYTGQGEIDVADTNLEAEKTLIEMTFAASSTVVRFDTVNAPNVPIFTGGLPDNAMTDRVFLIKAVTFPYNINFNRSTEIPTDLPTNDVSFAYFAEPGNTDSLDFPTLLLRFFRVTKDILTSTKVLSAYFNLSAHHVKNYSPFIPVYLNKYNAYFYLEKIENYIKGKLTKCKLIRL